MIAGRDITWRDIEAGGQRDFDFRGLRSRDRRRARRRSRQTSPVASNSAQWREVIGVVQRVHETGLYEEAPSIVYGPRWSRITS
jgi:hypothetical protein